MDEGRSFQDYLTAVTVQVERDLLQVFPEDWDMPSKLREAMQYSLMAGGKRMRPIMAIAAAEALGGCREATLPVACAVELVHTYSLIHDDLPAMDDDDLRRGKPTNHKVFGEAMAILAGDGLLTHAFSLVGRANRVHGVSAEQCLAIIEELSIYAGPKGMVGGQAADLLGEQGITSADELHYIHTHKTGDMIVCALKAGARTAGANQQHLNALDLYGYSIGLAFQIQDDILDLIGEEVKLGKPLKSDEKQHKVTYPFLIGLEASRQKVEDLTELGKQAVIQAGFPYPNRLLELADFLMKRDH
ncbi:MAG: polyprenyl synthetase family protein [Gorillibacterium sp.]|nr:polyprenyl synthetase family protein [Gorillibacterium sp.]